ncbi:MAG: hypothetical protein IJ752_02510 [Alphaproteobacteria bacterium]|nr:hypothetical protein [Alphaproteobacteria bacterium]
MNKFSLHPPTRQDLIAFQGLQRALTEKKAYIKINFKRLNKFRSPFFNPWENVLPLLFILGLSLALMIADNLIVGTAVLMVLCIGYAFLMPYFLEPFMQNRVTKRIIPRIEKFLVAWHYGGISIVLAADPRYSCQAPSGNWQQFIEAYFSDLIPQDMISKDAEKNA